MGFKSTYGWQDPFKTVEAPADVDTPRSFPRLTPGRLGTAPRPSSCAGFTPPPAPRPSEPAYGTREQRTEPTAVPAPAPAVLAPGPRRLPRAWAVAGSAPRPRATVLTPRSRSLPIARRSVRAVKLPTPGSACPFTALSSLCRVTRPCCGYSSPPPSPTF